MVLPTYMSPSHDVQITLFHHVKIEEKKKKYCENVAKTISCFTQFFSFMFTPKTAAICNKHVKFRIAFTRLCSWICMQQSSEENTKYLIKVLNIKQSACVSE